MITGTELAVRALDHVDLALRDRWAALAAAAENPFAMPAWHESWLRTRPTSAGLLLGVFRGTDVVGIVPLVVTRRAGSRVLRAPGGDLADFSGPACAPEDGRAVGEAFALALDEVLGPRDVLLLERSLTASGWDEALLAADGQGQLMVRTWRSDGVLVQVPLGSDAGPLRRSKDRREVDRLSRRLRRRGVQLRTATKDTVRPDLQALLALRRSRWDSPPQPAEDAFLLAVAEDAANDGVLRLWLLEDTGAVVAGLLGWSLHGRTFAHLMAFDPSYARWGPGTVLLADAVASAVADGDHVFDLLRGEEPHKRRYVVEHRGVSSRLIARRGTPAGAAVLGADLAQAAHGCLPTPCKAQLGRLLAAGLPRMSNRRPDDDAALRERARAE